MDLIFTLLVDICRNLGVSRISGPCRGKSVLTHFSQHGRSLPVTAKVITPCNTIIVEVWSSWISSQHISSEWLMWLNSKWTASFSNSVMNSQCISVSQISLWIAFRLVCLSKQRKTLKKKNQNNLSLPHPPLCQSETIWPKGNFPITW